MKINRFNNNQKIRSKKILTILLVFSCIACLNFGSTIQSKTINLEELSSREILVSESIQWVENGNAVCTEIGNQLYCQIVSDGQGGIIIAWQDDRDGEYDLYVQRITSEGQALWGVNGSLICNASGSQYNLKMVSDDQGGAIIAWQDDRRAMFASDAYVQRINSTGHPQWDVNGTVVCNQGAAAPTAIKIIKDGDNGAIIAWTDKRNLPQDVYAQRINSTGHAQWDANGTAISNESGEQYYVVLVGDGQGGAIIAWEDRRGAESDIYIQRVNSTGHAQLSLNGTIVCDTAGFQTQPEILSDGVGGAIVAWHHYIGTETDIYAQRINSNGQQLWSTERPICNEGGLQGLFQMTSDGENGAIAAWMDDRNGIYDIYAQRIDASGQIRWGENDVQVCSASDIQVWPRLVSDGFGGAIITWEDNRSGNFDIYGQRLNTQGTPQWVKDGISICTEIGTQSYTEMQSDNNGGAFVVWFDERSGSYDIYAQYITDESSQNSDSPAIPGFEIPIIGLIMVVITIVNTLLMKKRKARHDYR